MLYTLEGCFLSKRIKLLVPSTAFLKKTCSIYRDSGFKPMIYTSNNISKVTSPADTCHGRSFLIYLLKRANQGMGSYKIGNSMILPLFAKVFLDRKSVV